MSVITGSSAPIRSTTPINQASKHEAPDTAAAAKPKADGFDIGVGAFYGTFAGAGTAVLAAAMTGNKWSTATTIAVLGGITALGAVVGGFMARERSADTAQHDASGAAPDVYAREMISRFDHDESGSIDLQASQGRGYMDESVIDYGIQPWDSFEATAKPWRDSDKIAVATNIWNKADTDATKGVVSADELGSLMSKFDADADGNLSRTEQQQFHDANPAFMTSVID